ncbi:MAG TPA: SDR family oxidoreductase [Euzebya sp.]|nr:SDR family oxidoreductase [Euzebya sp.]
MDITHTPTALVTGASRGLGLALADHLVSLGWRVVTTARRQADLLRSSPPLADGGGPGAVPIAGDVGDPAHRAALALAAGPHLDLLVNNASLLGPSPLPSLADVPLHAVEEVLAVNLLAPLGLIQATLPALLARRGVIVDVSSDAAVGAWPGWGPYGLSKAALDQMTAVLGEEQPQLGVYAVDPGDMRTDMHQAAFPGEDISDRPLPRIVVPAFMELVNARPPSARYRLQPDGGWEPAGRQVPAGAA